MVRVCYTLLIAAASEMETGIENLWKSGKSGCRHQYPDFGKYISIHYFKAFVAAAPYCWCDKKHWYQDKGDENFSVIQPCIDGYNDNRKKLLKAVLLMLDESMSGWRPKTSKTGGLPKISFEPRKPVPLGTMFRNGVECISGIIVNQDISAGPEAQSYKYYSDLKSCLPGNPQVKAHTAEVLRQVKGAGIQKGGWVGGDAWFGSVMTLVEVMKQFEVYSTWIIKNNTEFFPMKVLHSILKARFGDSPAGHWVVMKATFPILDNEGNPAVDDKGKPVNQEMYAMAYAWSQRGVAYFLSNCGTTDKHPEPYISSFEDEIGNVTNKPLDRPCIAHFIYDFLPLIDEHNKQRQSILGLERKWPTTKAWFRVLTTLVGMSVVDLHRWDRNRRHTYWAGKGVSISEKDDEADKIMKFSDRMCGWLEDVVPKRARLPPRVPAARRNSGDEQWERIYGDDGSCTKAVTENDDDKRTVGSAKQKACYICRRYNKETGEHNKQYTAWQCKDCKMPLCKVNRAHTQPFRNGLSCMAEHFETPIGHMQCNPGANHGYGAFPKHDRVNLWPRKSKRNKRSQGLQIWKMWYHIVYNCMCF